MKVHQSYDRLVIVHVINKILNRTFCNKWTESKTENAWTTGDLDVCSTDDDTMLLSQSDSGDMVPFYGHWGPSQRLLCESEESLSTDDTIQSDPEDLDSASARELEGLHHGNCHESTDPPLPWWGLHGRGAFCY